MDDAAEGNPALLRLVAVAREAAKNFSASDRYLKPAKPAKKRKGLPGSVTIVTGTPTWRRCSWRGPASARTFPLDCGGA